MRENPLDSFSESPFPASRTEPLELAVTRGGAVESVHRIHARIVDREKKVMAHWGMQDLSVFPRSTIKPLQALPLILEGYGEKLRLDSRHLTLACASHYGEDFHVSTVREWLQKIGLGENHLECGPHTPFSEKAAADLILSGGSPGRLHNNCSGKHTGLLTACVECGFSPLGYSDYSHPIQNRQRQLLSGIFGLDLSSRPWGIDGCGIPTYSLPLKNVAEGMALCAGGQGEFSRAAVLLNEAIRKNPEYLESRESFCTEVAMDTDGRVIAKSGAEGIFTAWSEEKGWALVLKVEDGSERAAEAALCHLLGYLGFQNDSWQSTIGVRRWGGEKVGKILCR